MIANIINDELLEQNEQLLKSIQTRQDNLNELSKYLTELESQLALIFASSPDIIVFLNPNNQIVKISNAATRILGYTKEELIGQSVTKFIAPEDLEETKRIQQQILHDKLAYFDGENSFVNNWVTKYNTKVRLLWRFSICINNQLVGVATDITHFGTNAFYNLKLLQNTFDCLADGIVITDASRQDYPIAYINKSYERITGYTHEELVGKSCNILASTESVNSRAMQTLIKCKKEGLSCDILIQSNKKDGTIFFAHVLASPVIEKDVIVNYIGVIRDVTNLVGIEYDWSPNTERGFYPLNQYEQ